MNLGQDIKNKMIAAGFSAGQVAAKAGVSEGTISHWKTGVKASQRTYDKLIEALMTMIAERQEKMKKAGLLQD